MLLLFALCASSFAGQPDETAAVRVARSYFEALDARDLMLADVLFSAESVVYESGGVEGTWSHYRAHHLEPEIRALRSFDTTLGEPTEVGSADGTLAVVTWPLAYEVGVDDKVIGRSGTVTFVVESGSEGFAIRHLHWSSRAAPAADRAPDIEEPPDPESFATLVQVLGATLAEADAAAESSDFEKVVPLAERLARLGDKAPRVVFGLEDARVRLLATAASSVRNHSLALRAAAADADSAAVGAALMEVHDAVRQLERVPDARISAPRSKPARSGSHGSHGGHSH